MPLTFYSFQTNILPIKSLEQSDHKLERLSAIWPMNDGTLELENVKSKEYPDFSQRNLFVHVRSSSEPYATTTLNGNKFQVSEINWKISHLLAAQLMSIK